MTIIDIKVSGQIEKPEGIREVLTRVGDMVMDTTKHDGCEHEIKTSSAVATVTINKNCVEGECSTSKKS